MQFDADNKMFRPDAEDAWALYIKHFGTATYALEHVKELEEQISDAASRSEEEYLYFSSDTVFSSRNQLFSERERRIRLLQNMRTVIADALTSDIKDYNDISDLFESDE